jgi:hypothetical protein
MSLRHAVVGFSLLALPALAGQEWVDLFNGKDLSGWVQKGGKAQYAAENGMIVGSSVPGTPNSFLCTAKDYGDFVLEYEFKADPTLNSGVQLRSHCFDKATTCDNKGKTIKVAAGRVHGYQAEIDMDPKKDRWWTAGIYEEGCRGWLYPGAGGGDGKAFTAQGRKVSLRNEWNKVRVECRGDSIKTWLNGELRADLKDSLTPSGFIALQVHAVSTKGLRVCWRNLRIQPLTGDAKAP